ncbi:riboflavin synthase [Priestia endophytica]|jgi:riboflavin synthase|uniref:Riboflavin synthase n=2 Tax=Priestia endophytica TaxID=135735 RepID=A0AAX1Q3M5_9BACI|nr:riboflavin synthase [Priestia endophytica]KAB2496233.1 riboflavin synthase [Priestia endophytica]KYG31388.1 riboflavin synthase subunit alpha [Priestia endophytica]MBG9811744.1 riboflavin synthase subunit alpha [Priestia endophytica]MCM3536820.1 riboflavin synthase [Priestia endophytica]RAS72156.1 riboflavin synthase [Priestia endophytica]
MFTGIIEEIGEIERVEKKTDAIVFSIRANEILKDVNLGDSISVNGVCLTVTSFTKDRFTVDVMPETIKATNLKDFKQGVKVNLERAMAANGRFGGHFVSGHIDGTGEIVEVTPKGNAIYYRIHLSENLTRFLLLKGSVALDGTSLTIFGLERDELVVSLIPHTTDYTILGAKKRGDTVNIECDMIGKYLHKFVHKEEAKPEDKLSYEFLRNHGF